MKSTGNFIIYFLSFKERVEVSDGDSVGVGTGKVEIWRGPICGLLLLGGREAANKGGTEGLREAFWEWGILLLSLKLLWLGG